jgi:CMP-N-acetylneuraminic acid synthetase
MRLVDGRLEPLTSASDLEAPRQELPAAYRQNGAIYVVNVQSFRRGEGFWLPPAVPYFMTADESVDIDVETDLFRAEALLSARGAEAAR